MELQLHMKKLCFDIAEGGIMDENPPVQAFESLCTSESKHVQDSSCGKAEALDPPGSQWNLNEPYLHEPSDHLYQKETDSDDVLQCQTLLGKLPHDAAGEDLNTNKEHLKASNSNANEVKQDCSGVGPATQFASQRRPVVETLRDIMHTDVAYRQSFQARSTSNAQNIQPMITQAGELHREHDKPACKLGTPLSPHMVWSYRCPGLVMEREKAMELGRFTVLKSDKPCHLVVLRPFHVHGLPMRLIDASGNQWPMGWREFSLAEDLSDGDVCVFKLLDTTDLMFHVHVFRTERKSPRIAKQDDRPGKFEPHHWGATTVDPVFQEEQKLQECHQSITMQRAKPASNGSTAEVKKDSEISAQWWTRTCKPDKQCLRWQSEMSSLRCRKKPGASWRRLTGSNTSLSRNRQASSLLQARGGSQGCRMCIETMNPSVVVVRKKSNVYQNFIVKEVEIENKRDLGSYVARNLSILSGEVLTGGWQQFSVDHLLEEGDTCVFELITNKTEDLTFMVHIFRVVEVDHSKVQWQDHYMILSRGRGNLLPSEHYLTELDRPVLQSNEDGVLTEYNGILWWVPERAFFAGFSTCYLD
ncbi:hypothetical protein BDL97_13G014100 [Sphagnum fallax]|nr:hypothetical protein BDL97_13G014100 [Sphagnum fallax]